MNDYLEESKEVMEDTVFGESYDKELATYEGGFDEGRQAGFEEGIKEGERLTKLENANNLKNNGVSIEIIAKSLGLTKEEIEKL